MKQAIPGFDGYSVDSDGTVYGKTGSPLHPFKNWKGYLRVCIHQDGKRRYCTVHSLVLEAFVGPRPAGMQACHFDGNKENNRLDNLRWATASENQRDNARLGTIARGERNGAAKITAEQARLIVERRKAGGKEWGRAKIAEEFGISVDLASKIAHGKLWQHATGIHHAALAAQVPHKDKGEA